MKPIFLDAAQSDFDEAIDYYEKQTSGLGFELPMKLKKRWAALSTTPKPGRRFRRVYAAVSLSDSRMASSTKLEKKAWL
jgi:hypothetical protein